MDTPKTERQPDHLYFTGQTGPDGRPLAWLDGIPARDLDATDLANLTADQRRAAIGSGLYSQTAPVKPVAASAVTTARE